MKNICALLVLSLSSFYMQACCIGICLTKKQHIIEQVKGWEVGAILAYYDTKQENLQETYGYSKNNIAFLNDCLQKRLAADPALQEQVAKAIKQKKMLNIVNNMSPGKIVIHLQKSTQDFSHMTNDVEYGTTFRELIKQRVENDSALQQQVGKIKKDSEIKHHQFLLNPDARNKAHETHDQRRRSSVQPHQIPSEVVKCGLRMQDSQIMPALPGVPDETIVKDDA